MHSNNTQVQVQIPAYYSLGSVAIEGDLGFSGGGSTSFEHSQSAHSAASATTTLHPYNFPSNSVTSQFHPQSHHHHHHVAAQQQQQQQQQQTPAYSQSYTSPQHSSNNSSNNGNSASSSHGYQTDLQKPLVQHHVNIDQSPHQALDENLMTPLINRQLNNQHSSNYHAPYNYHNHHHNNHSSSKQQQQQLRSPTSTPAPTTASTLTTVSSASTPSLSSPSTLQNSQDYSYTADSNNRQTSPISTASPASSTATSNSFHIPASPDQLTIGHAGLTQAMSTWTPSNGSMNQQQESTQSGSSSSAAAREYVSLGYNDSPKSARSPYHPQQQGSPLYSQQDQQQQAWVASMSADDFSQQEILDQDRQQQPHQHHQRQYSQSNRNSYGQQSQQPSVATQQTSLTPAGGLPLLSPSNMLSSPDYQSSSYSMSMHDAPTIMSHLDYNRVTPSMPSLSSVAGNNNTASSRYGPMRATHPKSRPPSVSSMRDLGNRTRTNSVNSTSSISSSGVLTSLATTLGSATIGGGSELATTPEEYSRQLFDDEEEDSDSPTTIQMRPRCNTVPRKAIAARVFECSVPGCTKAYTQLHNLKSHERTGHTPIIKLKPFHCIIEGCSKAFSQRKSLATHIKTAHVDFKFKPFKCSQDGCTKAYTQLHNLRTHEKTVHMVDLSRKRIKNPMMGGSGLPFDPKNNHGHGQMDYHHSPQHSGLGLNYDDFNGLTGLGMRMDNQHPYQRPHQPQQPQHHQHHQQQQQYHQNSYARLPHFNSMSAFHDRS
ncbi:hypothetical protein EC957_000984 [Mortierella hygrophila]|uniref:C2H2-type domain-containing protein n=1 Tax=Mortierella hygrophila TaxID=979708 RepID=A0A9P6K2X6_9FUNG|nr:hypothetical protein EC957_000984 [Mortierella hygrophila]